MQKKEPKIETINVSLKEDHSDAIIVDYESDLESLCVQSVEDNIDPLVTDHSTIENIRIETDYKALYFETIQKYEKLKSHAIEIENNLAKEKKRADNYQNMLTKIFAEGEMHLVYRKKSQVWNHLIFKQSMCRLDCLLLYLQDLTENCRFSFDWYSRN